MARYRPRIFSTMGASIIMLLISLNANALPHSRVHDSSVSDGEAHSIDRENKSSQLLRRSPRGFHVGDDSRGGFAAQDDVGRLINAALRNGDLLDAEHWSDQRSYGRSRTTQRDTSQHQDLRTARVSLKPITRPAQGPEGRRMSHGYGTDLAAADTMQTDGRFIFPTDDEIRQPPQKVTQNPPPTCHGSTFCEAVPYYPEDAVNNAIQMNDSLKYLAGVDVVSGVVQRIDVNADDVPLCVSTEQVVFPKSAENKDKNWRYIVNQDNFQQGVRVEKCENENSDCSVVDGVAEGYRTTCKQKFIYRQLAAVANDGTVVPDMFVFPASCCCHAKFTGNALARMGINLGEEKKQTSASRTRRKK